MSATSSTTSILACLTGQPLAAVTFVRDYLQLQFDGPVVNGYVWPAVTVGDTTFRFEQPGYRDALCALIGVLVNGATVVPDDALRIAFADGASIEFSLREEARDGPEAVMLRCDDRAQWNVW